MTMESLPKPNHKAFRDLEGQRFERLTVLGFAGLKWRNAVWLCRCDCGTVKQVKSSQLTTNKTKSCGCLKNENVGNRNRTHGKSCTKDQLQSPAYTSWCNMKTRCLNKNRKTYPRYGGRGITICDQWMNSFETFYADMGEPPEGHTLDRIDNDGNYCPENCRWSTQSEQASNTTRNRVVEIDGQTMTAMQAAEKYGVSPFTIYGRLNRGLRDHDAVFGRTK